MTQDTHHHTRPHAAHRNDARMQGLLEAFQKGDKAAMEEVRTSSRDIESAACRGLILPLPPSPPSLPPSLSVIAHQQPHGEQQDAPEAPREGRCVGGTEGGRGLQGGEGGRAEGREEGGACSISTSTI